MKKTLWVLVLLLVLSVAAAANKSVTVQPKSETISGTLTIVSVEQKLIFVKAENGITYDFRIETATKIMENGTKLSIADLAGDIGRQVEVVFRPLKIGNVASTVSIK